MNLITTDKNVGAVVNGRTITWCRRNRDKNMRHDYDLPAEWEAMTDEQRRVQRRYVVIHG